MILVDDRERKSGVCEALEKLNIPFKITHLTTGDYVINDAVYIERKTVPDFLESLQDERLFTQVARLRSNGKRAVLIVEGDRLPGRPSIRGVLCSLAVQWCLPVLRSNGPNGTAWLLNRIAEKTGEKATAYYSYDMRPKRRISSLEERILLQLRTVGPEIARALLKRFGSVYDVLSASKEELMSVHGVGEYIAGQIILLRGGK